MSNFQAEKEVVLAYHKALDAAQDERSLTAVFEQYTNSDYFWRGMHPFYEQEGSRAVIDTFWLPFRRAFKSMQRRPDVFMAGRNDCDEGATVWVVSTGHLMGLFDNNWLGIPATGKMAFLRYAEFNRVENGKICDTALFCDVISVMQQAGLQPLPLQTGAAIINPGPRCHTGLLYDEQDHEESVKTLALINRMVDELMDSGMHSDQDELGNTWHDDMIWFGPAGIGATYTKERYEKQHQGPFVAGLKDIVYNGHKSRIAEGKFGGFFGWANLSMKADGGFLGMPASDIPTEMRVVDIYRRDGDKLAENWIYIDILHFLYKQGLDVLERMRSINQT